MEVLVAPDCRVEHRRLIFADLPMKGLILTYTLTFGGAVISLYRPFYGLLIYIAFAILRPESLWHWSVPAGNYSRIVAIALLVGWAFNGFGNWRFGRSRAILVCFVGYFGWALASTLTAALFPERGFAFLEATAKVLLPFVVGLTLITNLDQVKQIAWVIASSIALVALEMNLSYYGGFNRLREYGFGGMDNNCMAIQFVAAVGLVFFLGLSAATWWQRLFAIGATGVLVNAVMFSFSRGGLLSLIITAGLSFFLIPRRAIHYLAFGAAVAVGVQLAGPEVLSRFSSSFVETERLDGSASSRLDLWGNCWELMVRKPLFGVGPDHFGYYAAIDFGWPMGKEAHSLWFQTGAELGFVGVGLLLLFYLICIWRLWLQTRQSRPVFDSRVPDIARMVIASLAGFMAAAQFVSLEGLEFPYYVVLIGAGTLKVLHHHSAKGLDNDESEPVRSLPTGVAG
jgi:probable O-glycosylation ligase (exosortase A-associated)